MISLGLEFNSLTKRIKDDSKKSNMPHWKKSFCLFGFLQLKLIGIPKRKKWCHFIEHVSNIILTKNSGCLIGCMIILIFCIVKEILSFVAMWMKLEGIIQFEISQTERQILSDFSYIYNLNKQMNKQNKKKTDHLGGW